MNPQTPNTQLEQSIPSSTSSKISLDVFKEIINEITPEINLDEFESVDFYSKNEDYEMVTGTGPLLYVAGIRELTGDKQKTTFEYYLNNPDDTLRIRRVIDSTLEILTDGVDRADTFIKLNMAINDLIQKNPDYNSEQLEVMLVTTFLDDLFSLKEKSAAEEGKTLNLNSLSPQETATLVDAFLKSRGSKFVDKDLSKNNLREIISKISAQVSRDVFIRFMRILQNTQDQNIDENYDYSQLLNNEWLAAFIKSRNKGFETLY